MMSRIGNAEELRFTWVADRGIRTYRQEALSGVIGIWRSCEFPSS